MVASMSAMLNSPSLPALAPQLQTCEQQQNCCASSSCGASCSSALSPSTAVCLLHCVLYTPLNASSLAESGSHNNMLSLLSLANLKNLKKWLCWTRINTRAPVLKISNNIQSLYISSENCLIFLAPNRNFHIYVEILMSPQCCADIIKQILTLNHIISYCIILFYIQIFLV